jgi:hypothetical protein
MNATTMLPSPTAAVPSTIPATPNVPFANPVVLFASQPTRTSIANLANRCRGGASIDSACALL